MWLWFGSSLDEREEDKCYETQSALDQQSKLLSVQSSSKIKFIVIYLSLFCLFVCLFVNFLHYLTLLQCCNDLGSANKAC